jgi:hypothetical protein
MAGGCHGRSMYVVSGPRGAVSPRSRPAHTLPYDLSLVVDQELAGR